jgi:hypothetical protein
MRKTVLFYPEYGGSAFVFTHQTTWRHIPEDSEDHYHDIQNFKLHDKRRSST